jgi:hypothetical protein
MESPFAGLESALPLAGWRNGHHTSEKVAVVSRVAVTTIETTVLFLMDQRLN